MKNKAQYPLMISKDKMDLLRAEAKARDMSFNGYLKSLIFSQIKLETESPILKVEDSVIPFQKHG